MLNLGTFIFRSKPSADYDKSGGGVTSWMKSWWAGGNRASSNGDEKAKKIKVIA
jgi:hypothetical protein